MKEYSPLFYNVAYATKTDTHTQSHAKCKSTHTHTHRNTTFITSKETDHLAFYSCLCDCIMLALFLFCVYSYKLKNKKLAEEQYGFSSSGHEIPILVAKATTFNEKVMPF